jgi:hypothetical protein
VGVPPGRAVDAPFLVFGILIKSDARVRITSNMLSGHTTAPLTGTTNAEFVRALAESLPTERLRTSIETKLAMRGYDLSDRAILNRNAHRLHCTEGQRMERYMELRDYVQALHQGTPLSTATTTKSNVPLQRFLAEDALRAFELCLFGSVLTLPAHDPLLIHLGVVARSYNADE